MLVIAYSLSFGPDSLLKTIFKINEGKSREYIWAWVIPPLSVKAWSMGYHLRKMSCKQVTLVQ